jgi:hypothetical protein
MPIVSSIFTPADITQKRMDICRGCDKYMSTFMRCKECGCVMPLKVRLKGQECPLQKWGPVDDDGKEHHVPDSDWEEQEKAVETALNSFKLKNPLDGP